MLHNSTDWPGTAKSSKAVNGRALSAQQKLPQRKPGNGQYYLPLPNPFRMIGADSSRAETSIGGSPPTDRDRKLKMDLPGPRIRNTESVHHLDNFGGLLAHTGSRPFLSKEPINGSNFAGQKHAANFVGGWAPTILILGVYNKIVKVMGSD